MKILNILDKVTCKMTGMNKTNGTHEGIVCSAVDSAKHVQPVGPAAGLIH